MTSSINEETTFHIDDSQFQCLICFKNHDDFLKDVTQRSFHLLRQIFEKGTPRENAKHIIAYGHSAVDPKTKWIHACCKECFENCIKQSVEERIPLNCTQCRLNFLNTNDLQRFVINLETKEGTFEILSLETISGTALAKQFEENCALEMQAYHLSYSVMLFPFFQAVLIAIINSGAVVLYQNNNETSDFSRTFPRCEKAFLGSIAAMLILAPMSCGMLFSLDDSAIISARHLPPRPYFELFADEKGTAIAAMASVILIPVNIKLGELTIKLVNEIPKSNLSSCLSFLGLIWVFFYLGTMIGSLPKQLRPVTEPVMLKNL